jgi:hypothetical protein
LPGVREALDILAEGDPEDRDDEDDPNDGADLDDEDDEDDEENDGDDNDDEDEDEDRRTFKLMRLFFDAKDFETIQRQLRDLKTLYPRTADIFRAALRELHDTHFPDRRDADDPVDDRQLDARF